MPWLMCSRHMRSLPARSDTQLIKPYCFPSRVAVSCHVHQLHKRFLSADCALSPTIHAACAQTPHAAPRSVQPFPTECACHVFVDLRSQPFLNQRPTTRRSEEDTDADSLRFGMGCPLFSAASASELVGGVSLNPLDGIADDESHEGTNMRRLGGAVGGADAGSPLVSSSGNSSVSARHARHRLGGEAIKARQRDIYVIVRA
eukprot:2236914-Prymnesium_polylepis.3